MNRPIRVPVRRPGPTARAVPLLAAGRRPQRQRPSRPFVVGVWRYRTLVFVRRGTAERENLTAEKPRAAEQRERRRRRSPVRRALILLGLMLLPRLLRSRRRAWITASEQPRLTARQAPRLPAPAHRDGERLGK